MKKFAAAIAIALVSLGASAQSTYQEFAVSKQNIKVSASAASGNASVSVGLSSSPTIANFTTGYEFNKNLAAEFNAFGTLSTDALTASASATDGARSVSASGSVGSVSASGLGVGVRVKTAATDNLDLYGRVGVARNKITVSGTNSIIDGSESQTSPYYAVGANYAVSKAVYVGAEFRAQHNKDIKSSGAAVTIGYRF